QKTIRLSSNSLKIIIKILASVLFDKEPFSIKNKFLYIKNSMVNNKKTMEKKELYVISPYSFI
ncbi:hypothetical protein, partial [Ligilactobacillus salivarius]|uniref:hypothetical protein n=1 Tax=Ligilactobacillus salivarius TaxID=1624 RepID=UPI001CDAEFD7